MIILKSVSEVYSLKFYNDNKIISENIYALKNISLNINQGEIVNVIGANGSGKSTLLKVICGVIEPYSGIVSVSGRVGLIIDIGCGFHPDLTGRENILASASLYGYSKEHVTSIIPDVYEFSELGKYFDAPIRTYSQGMYLRLAFSYALNINPDILCIDDIISVGDESYREKCLSKINEFKNKGKTIILVTHDLYFASDFADRTIWINEGEILFDGDTKEAITNYKSFVRNKGILNISNFSPFHLKEKENSFFIFYNNIIIGNISEIFLSDYVPFLIQANRIDNLEKFIFNNLEIIEKGRNFIKLIECNNKAGISLEITLSLYNESLIIEYFIRNIIGRINGEILLEFCIPLLLKIKELFVFDSDYFYLLENNECIFNIFSNNLCLKTIFHPSVSKKDIYVDNENIIKFKLLGEVPKYNDSSKRVMSLKFDFIKGVMKESNFLKEKENFFLKKRIHFGNSFIQLADHGIYFKRKEKSLFAFNGVEFLFSYKGVECSSNHAKIFVLSVNDNKNMINVMYQSIYWPVDILLSIEFINENLLSFKYKTNYLNEFKIENLRIQFLFDASLVKTINSSIDENRNSIMLNINDEVMQIENKCDKELFLFSHNYNEKNKSAFVVYFLDKMPICNKEYKFECLFNEKITLSKNDIFERRLDELDFVNGKIGLMYNNIEILKGWKNYLSIFSGNIWHDSLKCIWKESSKGLYHGDMPWLPVLLEIKILKFDNAAYNVNYSFISKNDICINKLEIVYPINDVYDILYNESSLGETYEEHIKKGINLNQFNLLFFYKDTKFSFSFISEETFMLNFSESLHSQKTLKITFYFDNKCFKKGKYEFGHAKFSKNQ